ncbi:hypothetical protein ACM26E_24380 [Kluyvera cryocrescens]|mgnify:CR=1 FL=1|uniref:hypothetical protein n=1 Tax=Kluyvera cryocrescens TaxID=580 RepID=UPI0011F264A8|nr:hypothetical protein [Klebsiella aerogenes]TZG29731.1 hypothetical protein FYF90_04030 [Enterobacter sp. RVSM5a]HAV1487355.1 hypothetical protein [Enterobacter hormaechei subsp. steigerwaltii]HED2320977.1 hypothetical protein [Citrobacter freundii]HED3523135.1 hypothetical protein [Citrobacter freundii]
MKKITLLLTLLASVQASAAANQWTSTWVQGVTEYHIQGKDGAELLLTCSPDDNAFVQYTAPDGKTLTSGGDDGRSVQAQVDSGDSFLINDTFSDAGGSNFEAFWNAARQSHQLHITATGLASTTFTFSNSRKVLPPFDKSGCLTRM